MLDFATQTRFEAFPAATLAGVRELRAGRRTSFMASPDSRTGAEVCTIVLDEVVRSRVLSEAARPGVLKEVARSGAVGHPTELAALGHPDGADLSDIPLPDFERFLRSGTLGKTAASALGTVEAPFTVLASAGPPGAGGSASTLAGSGGSTAFIECDFLPASSASNKFAEASSAYC